MDLHEERFRAALARYPALRTGGEPIQLLGAALDAICPILDVSGAAVMLGVEDGHPVVVATTPHDIPAAVEKAQLATHDGPCLEAYREGRVVTTADLSHDDRWPALRSHLSREVRAVMALPLTVDGEVIGCLSLFCEETVGWSDRQAAAAAAYTGVLEHVLAGVGRG